MSVAIEVFAGVFHWTAVNDAIGSEVSSYYLADSKAAIDPMLPAGGATELPGPVERIILSSGHHNRDAGRLSDETGAPITGIPEVADYLDGQLTVETIGHGDEFAPGVTALHIGVLCDDEGGVHIAQGGGALVIADAVRLKDGELGFFSDSLLGDDPAAVKRGLKREFRGLLELDFDHLLFAHSEPLIGGGKAALEEFAKE